jgi:FkbM family methyltransferase
VDKVLKTLDKNIPTRAEREYGTLCFSQSGEDGILNYLLPSYGFYIDVGAHHPLRYSNTHMLYRRGWRGINIEPTPEAKKLFDLHRPGDLNLELAVGRLKTKETFYVFEEGCYNTFDAVRAKEITKKKISKMITARKIPVKPLGEICKAYMARGQAVQLLTVDAEGKDTEILETHDWKNYRPRHVVVEHHGENYARWKNPSSFLRQKGYYLVSRTPFSAIFEDTRGKSRHG